METLATGERYVGHFSFGLRHGRGALYASGATLVPTYAGEFFRGVPHGRGTVYVAGAGAGGAPAPVQAQFAYGRLTSAPQLQQVMQQQQIAYRQMLMQQQQQQQQPRSQEETAYVVPYKVRDIHNLDEPGPG